MDRRGRLLRLAISSAIGLVITLGIMKLIAGAARAPNPDAISQASPAFLGIAMFVVISYGVFATITKLKKRAES